MKSNHELPKGYASELRQLDKWHIQASSSGFDRKSLEIRVGQELFRVVYNDKVMYQGRSAKKAVETYNDCQA